MVERTGILGVDIAHKTVGRAYYTVVQVLFDDHLPDGDDSILSCPLVAEITRPIDPSPLSAALAQDGGSGDPAEAAEDRAAQVVYGGDDEDDQEIQVVATALFDHYEFRRKLHEEREAGVDETHGILVLDGGDLPDRYVRFAFVPFSVRLTAGMDLRVYRTTVEDLTAKVEDAFAQGRINEADRRNMLVSIEQHYVG